MIRRPPYSPRTDPLFPTPTFFRSPLGGVGEEGTGAAVRRRRAVPARPLVRQRHRTAAALLPAAMARARCDARRGGLAAGAARGVRACRAPAADERRALRPAAVGRPRLFAGRRLRGPLRASPGPRRRRFGRPVAAAAPVRGRPRRGSTP